MIIIHVQINNRQEGFFQQGHFCFKGSGHWDFADAEERTSNLPTPQRFMMQIIARISSDPMQTTVRVSTENL